jgi:hypothetical protein
MAETGSMPRLQKTEPWELITAFVQAMDQHTNQQNEMRNRLALQEMKEAGDDRRLEKGHSFGMERLREELGLKSKYEAEGDVRKHGLSEQSAEAGLGRQQKLDAFRTDQNIRQERHSSLVRSGKRKRSRTSLTPRRASATLIEASKMLSGEMNTGSKRNKNALILSSR